MEEIHQIKETVRLNKDKIGYVTHTPIKDLNNYDVPEPVHAIDITNMITGEIMFIDNCFIFLKGKPNSLINVTYYCNK